MLPVNSAVLRLPRFLPADSWWVPYGRDQHPVTGLDAHGNPLALPVHTAGADGQDLGLVQLLDARLGQEDAGGGLGLGLDTLDQDAVQEGHEGLDRSDGGGLVGQL